MYKKMYYHLFNAMTDAWEALERGDCGAAREILRRAQLETEEMYLSAGDEEEA